MVTRREFLKCLGFLTAALAVGPSLAKTQPRTTVTRMSVAGGLSFPRYMRVCQTYTTPRTVWTEGSHSPNGPWFRVNYPNIMLSHG